jgi:hypothetical protein
METHQKFPTSLYPIFVSRETESSLAEVYYILSLYKRDLSRTRQTVGCRLGISNLKYVQNMPRATEPPSLIAECHLHPG